MPNTPLMWFQIGLLIGILATLFQMDRVLTFKKICHRHRAFNARIPIYEEMLSRHRHYLMGFIGFSAIMFFGWIHYL